MNKDEKTGVINKDHFDREFTRKLAANDRVKETLEKLPVPDAAQLFGDIWASLFKAAPRMKDADECTGSEYMHRKIMEQAMGMSSFHRLRNFTVLDTQSASLGSMTFSEELQMPDDVKKAMEDVKKAEEALKSNTGTPEDMEAAINAFDQTCETNHMAISDSIIRASKNAAEKAEAAHAAGLTLGWGNEKGAGDMLDPAAAMTLMDKLSQDRMLMEILKLAGRLAPIALSTLRNRTRKASDVIVSVKTGNDLRHIVPCELAALASEDRELDFLRRFSEAELMEYDLIGNIPEGKGPVIIAKDESGSMSGVPHIWATAICLAIAQACQKEKRDFAVIHFGSDSEIKTDHFITGESASLTSMAQHFFGGGTSFESPLREALKIASDHQYDKADIIFITDGLCQLSETFEAEIAAEKETRNMRLIAVAVNGGGVKAMQRVADLAVHIGTDENDAVRLINDALDAR